MRIREIYFIIALVLTACELNQEPGNQESTLPIIPNGAYLEVLGTAQDAGYPQANCEKDCCKKVWENPELEEQVVSLALLDPSNLKSYMFDATPDFPRQLQATKESLPGVELSGIFLTHAHIGHYTGLMYLGHEAMGANEIPVYAMPRMDAYLRNNGPWSQLVNFENISLKSLRADSLIAISDSLFVKPLLVPHRDEYSETVGYMIYGPSKKAIFLPDIDKWEKWDRDIKEIISEVDYAFLDASFYANGEIPGRDMSQIPHPFVEESMDFFKDLFKVDKSKIHFIHFNHTNPLLQPDSEQSQAVLKAGYKIARTGMRFEM